MFSTLLSNGEEEVFIFSADEAAAYIQSEKIPNHDASEAFIEPVTKSGDHVMGIPACYTDSFGNDYYIEQTYSALANQTREQWQIRVEGQLCNTGMQLNVTDYDTLRLAERRMIQSCVTSNVESPANLLDAPTI